MQLWKYYFKIVQNHLIVQKFGVSQIFKKCFEKNKSIYLIKNTVKSVILWNIITI